MSLDNMEYNMLLNSLTKRTQERQVPMRRLITLLVLTSAATVGQLALAQLSHCITLLTLVHQNIYNALTILVSVLTQWKNEKTLRNTFGWHRMEVVGSISSLVFLFSLCFATAIEALQTLFHNDHLDTMHHPEWIMLVTGGNILLWVLSFFLIGGYSYHQRLAVRERQSKEKILSADSIPTALERPKEMRDKDKGVNSWNYFSRTRTVDVTRDMSGSFFTLLTCALVYFKVVTEDFSQYIDPTICIVYIIVLIWSCVPLVKDSCLILLQTIPGNVEISVLKKYLLKKFPGILSLHEFHTWTFTPGTLVLTGHVVYQDKSVYQEINKQVESFFYSQGFSQVTIQPEFPVSINPSLEDISECTLKCKGDVCVPKSCCNEETGQTFNARG